MTQTRNSTASNVNPSGDNADISLLTKEGKLIVSLIFKRFDQMEQTLKAKDEKISALESSMNKLQKRLDTLEQQIDSNSNYERRDTLVISGNIPQAQPNENCIDIVRNSIKNEMRLIIDEKDISTAHRLGRKPENGQRDKRSIIFKLCRRETKRDILQACRTSKPKFYINEHLTPTRSTIMFALRKAHQMDPNKIGVARTREGNVTVQVPADGSSNDNNSTQRITCNTRAILDDLLMKHLNIKSDKFVKSWPTI